VAYVPQGPLFCLPIFGLTGGLTPLAAKNGALRRFGSSNPRRSSLDTKSDFCRVRVRWTQDGRQNMLNNIGLPGLLLIAVVVLVLFGRGKISSLMGEVGKGITSFKKGVNEGTKELEEQAAEEAKDVTPESDKDKV
jgi:sec-independent protein translocase protein TatA